jgi:phenylacetate-CoA ligase
MKDYPGIRQFQVVQEELHRVQIRFVLKNQFSEDHRISLNGEIRKILGPAVDLQLLSVDDIPLTAAGKHRVVVSHCRDH